MNRNRYLIATMLDGIRKASFRFTWINNQQRGQPFSEEESYHIQLMLDEGLIAVSDRATDVTWGENRVQSVLNVYLTWKGHDWLEEYEKKSHA